MSTLTDAVFFLRDGRVVQEMMKSEFDALLDGIVDMPDFSGRKTAAVYLQINDSLKIKALVFFVLTFDKQGHVSADWNVPINQLMQSAGRGPDLGAGPIRLVCKSQCSVPWHAENLWDPAQQIYVELAQAVQDNRLGIIENDDAWQFRDEHWDIPVLTAEPPVLTAIPTLEPPLLTPAVSDEDIPVLTPAKPKASAKAPAEKAEAKPAEAKPIAEPAKEAAATKGAEDTAAIAAQYAQLKQEFDAMKAAYGVRIDKLQKERDELKEKNKTISESLKLQAKQHIETLTQDFTNDLEKKDQQVAALKEQIAIEQKRYSELKAQQAEQAAQYQIEREELIERLQQDEDASQEIEALKVAFAKELAAKVEAETTSVNARLAMREVELFYREEQMSLLRDEISQLKNEKQQLLAEKDRDTFQALEDRGVTLVVFQAGLGHITLAFDDVGRFLDDRNEYLANRCSVSREDFIQWQQHYQQPVCQHAGCNTPVKRVEMLAHFNPGVSDRCAAHIQR